MQNILEAVRGYQATFLAEKTKKFDNQREVTSSANFFWLMDQIYKQKISGSREDEQGNTAEAYRSRYTTVGEGYVTHGAKLNVFQSLPLGENLGVNTSFEWRRDWDDKTIGVYISIGHKGTGDRVSSLSKYDILKAPKGSNELNYQFGWYDSNDNDFGIADHTALLAQETFRAVTGRAYEIAFNLLARKGDPKPLSLPHAGLMLPQTIIS